MSSSLVLVSRVCLRLTNFSNAAIPMSCWKPIPRMWVDVFERFAERIGASLAGSLSRHLGAGHTQGLQLR